MESTEKTSKVLVSKATMLLGQLKNHNIEDVIEMSRFILIHLTMK
jgi:hypothetical protein